MQGVLSPPSLQEGGVASRLLAGVGQGLLGSSSISGRAGLGTAVRTPGSFAAILSMSVNGVSAFSETALETAKMLERVSVGGCSGSRSLSSLRLEMAWILGTHVPYWTGRQCWTLFSTVTLGGLRLLRLPGHQLFHHCAGKAQGTTALGPLEVWPQHGQCPAVFSQSPAARVSAPLHPSTRPGPLCPAPPA